MKLSNQERYDILNDKEKFLHLPVSFIHPVNSAPGEIQYEKSVEAYWNVVDLSRSYKADLLEYLHSFPCSGSIYKEFDGTHKWRSIRGGLELVTNGIAPAQWSGWVLRTKDLNWNSLFECPDSYRDERICIETYVLVDSITEDQYQAWENFRRTQCAAFKQHMKHLDSVQMSFL